MASFPNDADEKQLAALWAAYRTACGEPDASPQFMPQLWQKIESRQRVPMIFRRVAGVLATAAVAASLVLAVISAPRPSRSNFYNSTYLEVLAEHYAAQSPVYTEPLSVSTDSDTELLNEML